MKLSRKKKGSCVSPQKHRYNLFVLGCVSLGAASAYAQATDPADSQGTLAEIKVTATRREEALNKVPLSVVATDQEALDKQGVRSADDLMRLTPSITFGQSSQFYGTG